MPQKEIDSTYLVTTYHIEPEKQLTNPEIQPKMLMTQTIGSFDIIDLKKVSLGSVSRL